MLDMNDSLGIPNFGPWYLELSSDQDCLIELLNIYDFMESIVDSNRVYEFNGNTIDIQFINYGEVQLVFVITVDNNRQYTILINQPATKYGVGKNEFNNLNKLNKIDCNVVIKPMYYFERYNQELYITPYYYQARCIGIDTTVWGIWVPEPDYHFKNFNNEERKIINATMVALIVKLYDEENNMGLSKCRLDGGDFMLLKGFENYEFNFDNIYKNMKLIAARELISLDFQEYIDRLRIELADNMLRDDELIIIGKKLQNPLTDDEIEIGIEMGLKLRNKSEIQYKLSRYPL